MCVIIMFCLFIFLLVRAGNILLWIGLLSCWSGDKCKRASFPDSIQSSVLGHRCNYEFFHFCGANESWDVSSYITKEMVQNNLFHKKTLWWTKPLSMSAKCAHRKRFFVY